MEVIEEYTVLIDGRKTYRCDFCDFGSKNKADFNNHLKRKKHADNKRNSATPLVGVEMEKPPPPSRPVPQPNTGCTIVQVPTARMKGKTYLNKKCDDAIKIDTTIHHLQHWARLFELTNQDINLWFALEPNKYLMDYTMKLIKKYGRNKMPYRCTDISRKRFYYNDASVGWTEDICNLQVIKYCRNLFSNSYITANQQFIKGWYNDDNKRIQLEELNEVAVKYVFWIEPRPSSEACYNKTQAGAEKEKADALEILGELLRCGDDSDEDSS